MVLLRMFALALQLTWPYLLTPWRSPLLRWRMETYGITDRDGRLLRADDITPAIFLRFLLLRRHALVRFLSWASLVASPPIRRYNPGDDRGRACITRRECVNVRRPW